MRIFLALLFCSVAVASASAGQLKQQTTTLYLDGAVVEQAGAAVGGVVEVPLPAAMQPGSLRVKPLSGAAIDRVEILPPKSGSRETEALRLKERQEQLGDRLRALETREEIFRAAAKAQSGKAPRRTKTNPEPLSTIRKGTDFALAQLEEVYRARRKAEKELKEVTTALSARKEQMGDQNTARIVLKGKSGKVGISYIRPDLKWLPRYDFRLDGSGTAEVTVRAHLPAWAKGTLFVVPSLLADAVPETRLPVSAQHDAMVISFRSTASHERFLPGPRSSAAFVVKNVTSGKLPEGVATCYWKGEYLGTTPFPGFGPGESREVAAGR